MKYPKNVKDVASLHPDYIGFIFYEKSRRNFDKEIPRIANKIKKTGVFVNATKDFILKKVEKYNLKSNKFKFIYFYYQNQICGN